MWWCDVLHDNGSGQVALNCHVPSPCSALGMLLSYTHAAVVAAGARSTWMDFESRFEHANLLGLGKFDYGLVRYGHDSHAGVWCLAENQTKRRECLWNRKKIQRWQLTDIQEAKTQKSSYPWSLNHRHTSKKNTIPKGLAVWLFGSQESNLFTLSNKNSEQFM